MVKLSKRLHQLLTHLGKQAHLKLLESFKLNVAGFDTVNDHTFIGVLPFLSRSLHEGQCRTHHFLHSLEPMGRVGQVGYDEQTDCFRVGIYQEFFPEDLPVALTEEVESLLGLLFEVLPLACTHLKSFVAGQKCLVFERVEFTRCVVGYAGQSLRE